MRSKLQEGMVIQSDFFVTGYVGEMGLRVGNYDKEAFSRYSHFPLVDDESRKNKKYVIIEAREYEPRITIGNRESSYENNFIAKELNADGTYNENGEEFQFTTASVFSGYVKETDIEILGQMRKIYV